MVYKYGVVIVITYRYINKLLLSYTTSGVKCLAIIFINTNVVWDEDLYAKR